MPLSRLLADVLRRQRDELVHRWLRQQKSAVKAADAWGQDLHEQCARFLDALADALGQSGDCDLAAPEWSEVRGFIGHLSGTRAQRGATPADTAQFFFSLKEPVLDLVEAEVDDPGRRLELIRHVALVLDKLGICSMEVYQESREEIIRLQQKELMELSTPVVQLWTSILALPLVGTLDRNRTQIVMETLLQRIVDTEATVAIVDITGVPVVDTLVAQHLLKTVAATRLMGAHCIISGIRPQIAQTIVHLGLDLGEVTTKATLADAFAAALTLLGHSLPGRDEGRRRS